MKHKSHVALLALAMGCAHAAPLDLSLIGCWRSVHIVHHAAEGSDIEDRSGRCVLEFKADHFDSKCASSTGLAVTTYRYEIVRPHFYAATMTASTFRTNLVGSTRESEYHVQGDRLRIVTPATRVESESKKVACD